MIQSLSDRQRHKKTKIKRVILISLTAFLVVFWVFLRPVFLFVADPLILLYGNVSGSLYTKYQKVQTFFTSKDKTLSYVRALEEENSRLHNKLALLEHSDCLPQKIEGNKREDIDIDVASTASASTSMIGTTTHQVASLFDPCLLARKQQSHEITDSGFMQVSPMLSHLSYIFDTMRISKGATDGVEEGDMVFTRGMIVIGKVLSVSKHSSLVELYSKEGIESYGTLLSGDSFKVNGIGGGSYEAYIPKDVAVSVGEKILFTWDQDLALGEVVAVESEKQDVSQKVSIRGGFNPAKLPVMYIKNHE